MAFMYFYVDTDYRVRTTSVNKVTQNRIFPCSIHFYGFVAVYNPPEYVTSNNVKCYLSKFLAKLSKNRGEIQYMCYCMCVASHSFRELISKNRLASSSRTPIY